MFIIIGRAHQLRNHIVLCCNIFYQYKLSLYVKILHLLNSKIKIIQALCLCWIGGDEGICTGIFSIMKMTSGSMPMVDLIVKQRRRH